MKEDKKRLKDEKRIAKARIRAERERGGSQVGILRQLAGMSTKSDRSKKTHEERLKRQKKARSQAGDVSSFIGYDVIYQDGIAQVEEGLFSQTIEFSDISYQSARRENQQNIFTVLSSLYNYFGADSCVQLTIANVPIPDDEIGRKRFFKAADPDTAEYAKEYNRILNDKMREGVSNLMRHRYLTYMVGADDVWEAVPKLSRIKGDVTDTLSRIRCEAHALRRSNRAVAVGVLVWALDDSEAPPLKEYLCSVRAHGCQVFHDDLLLVLGSPLWLALWHEGRPGSRSLARGKANRLMGRNSRRASFSKRQRFVFQVWEEAFWKRNRKSIAALARGARLWANVGAAKESEGRAWREGHRKIERFGRGRSGRPARRGRAMS